MALLRRPENDKRIAELEEVLQKECALYQKHESDANALERAGKAVPRALMELLRSAGDRAA